MRLKELYELDLYLDYIKMRLDLLEVEVNKLMSDWDVLLNRYK